MRRLELGFLALVFAAGCTGNEDADADADALGSSDVPQGSSEPGPSGEGPGQQPSVEEPSVEPNEPSVEPEGAATPEPGAEPEGPPATPEPAAEPEPMPAPTRPRPMPGFPGFGDGGSFGSGGEGSEPEPGSGPGQGGSPGSGGAGEPATGGMAGASGGQSSGGQGGSGECVPDYECEPEAPDTGDYYADCVARVSQFRACVCLPPLERNYDAEACLDQQAEYDSDQDQAHAGFSDNVCQPTGNSQNECPGWGNATQVVEGCIQQMFDEGLPPEDPCDGQCYQEHGHFINMTSTSVTSVACGMFDGDNGFWAVQNFFR
jgi:hypothetical protein